MHPASVKATLPHLHVLPDESVLVSGDESKSDRYFVTFDNVPSEITALRFEALPDASLPKHGPGRIFYEGPFGDFQLSEFTATVDGAPVHFKAAAQSFASNPGGAAAAIDGSPLTSWSSTEVRANHTRPSSFPTSRCATSKHLSIEMLFEYYYAAGLGHFRISAATTPVAADRQVLPPEIDDLLIVPARAGTQLQQVALSRYFASIVPELEAARKKIRGSPRCGADLADEPGDVGATGRQSASDICPQAGRLPAARPNASKPGCSRCSAAGVENWPA